MSPRRAGGTTVGFQGDPGANGETAIATYWHGSARAVPVRSFGALAAAVADGGVEFGVVPVWNSIIGAVAEAHDALARVGDRVVQVGEVVVRVRHALLALPGTSLDAIRAVGSHRAALAQCRGFLAAHPSITPVVAWDTAGAARELAALARRGPSADAHGTQGGPWHAAVADVAPASLAVIADPSVARRHGLAVLAEEIHDHAQGAPETTGAAGNVTRFAVMRTREAAWSW